MTGAGPDATLMERVGSARPRPALGYAMTFVAASLLAVNGPVVKALLGSSGLSTMRLTELRTAGAAVFLVVVVAAIAPRRLRVSVREIPFFLLYGGVCFVLVSWLYFVAIDRLPIGIAVPLQFTAPVLVALWAMLVWRRPVRSTVWIALALALAGVLLVSRVWSGFELDGIGVAAAGGAAVALAAYFLIGERAVTQRDPLSLLALAFVFAAVVWAIAQPWWSFPFEALGGSASLGGALAEISLPAWVLVVLMVVPGTIVPFGLELYALRHLPATHVALVAMVEPVAAGVVGWAWLEESIGAVALVGVAVTLAGTTLAQTARR